MDLLDNDDGHPIIGAIDDLAEFDCASRQSVLHRKAWVKRQMVPTADAINRSLESYARTLRWEEVGRG